MSKDRPWHRKPNPEPSEGPRAEPPVDSLPLAGLEIHSMDDAQVRDYCLAWARHYLVRYDMGRLNEDHLERAARFAQIAQAFRPGPEPDREQPG